MFARRPAEKAQVSRAWRADGDTSRYRGLLLGGDVGRTTHVSDAQGAITARCGALAQMPIRPNFLDYVSLPRGHLWRHAVITSVAPIKSIHHYRAG
jgi:hypothetical protein